MNANRNEIFNIQAPTLFQSAPPIGDLSHLPISEPPETPPPQDLELRFVTPAKHVQSAPQSSSRTRNLLLLRFPLREQIIQAEETRKQRVLRVALNGPALTFRIAGLNQVISYAKDKEIAEE